jgi:hypothetical protein
MNQESYEDTQVTGWVGWITFAAVMLAISGGLNFFYGLIAAINDEWVVFGNRADVYLDVSAWGWIHMILGAVVFAAGLALLSGNILARIVGVIAATVSIVANFMWLPVYPVWSIILITLDVLIIWALTVHGREMRA